MPIQFAGAILGKPARSTGRKRKFDDATKQRLRGKVRTRALSWKADHGRLPSLKQILGAAHKLAAAEGVNDASDRVLQRQVIGPVLRELRREK
jgi:hypothetical protein